MRAPIVTRSGKRGKGEQPSSTSPSTPTKNFDYVWEEIAILVSYKTDWEKGRDVVLEEIEAATCDFRDQSAGALVEMARRYLVARSEVEPLVFVKLTATGLSSPPASCSRYALPPGKEHHLRERPQGFLAGERHHCLGDERDLRFPAPVGRGVGEDTRRPPPPQRRPRGRDPDARGSVISYSTRQPGRTRTPEACGTPFHTLGQLGMYQSQCPKAASGRRLLVRRDQPDY